MNTFQEISASNISLSKRTLICNIGINDALYITQPIINNKRYCCPYYQVWVSMIKRCYSKKYQNKQPTYIGCIVCEDWILFSNFKAWMESQDWIEKELDKDLLIQGNKLYSPETCIFVSKRINCLLSDSKAIRGIYKQGVSYHIRDKVFRAYCKDGSGKAVHLGYFKTEDEAFNAYCKFKYSLIYQIASSVLDERLKKALINYKIL